VSFCCLYDGDNIETKYAGIVDNSGNPRPVFNAYENLVHLNPTSIPSIVSSEDVTHASLGSGKVMLWNFKHPLQTVPLTYSEYTNLVTGYHTNQSASSIDIGTEPIEVTI